MTFYRNYKDKDALLAEASINLVNKEYNEEYDEILAKETDVEEIEYQSLFKKWKKTLRKLFYGEDDDDYAENEQENEDVDNDTEIEERDNRRGTEKDKGSKEGLDEDGYMIFNIPWSFSISYGITMTEDRSRNINVKNMRYPYKFVHNLNFSGNVKLSSNWNVNFTSGWDFTTKELTMTTVNISRDMHCFNISAGFVFGPFTSYHVTMRANASTLTDALKYDKKSSYSSSIQWY